MLLALLAVLPSLAAAAPQFSGEWCSPSDTPAAPTAYPNSKLRFVDDSGFFWDDQWCRWFDRAQTVVLCGTTPREVEFMPVGQGFLFAVVTGITPGPQYFTRCE
jgi:hypothetical protein